MQEISTEFFEKCIPILNALAKRKNPNCQKWRQYTGSTSHKVICNICNQIDKYSLAATSLQEIRRHGLQHLKEHNLLPFI